MSVRTTKGQITEATTGAIVNAANSGLREGSGVCGAISVQSGLPADTGRTAS